MAMWRCGNLTHFTTRSESRFAMHLYGASALSEFAIRVQLSCLECGRGRDL